MKLKKKEQKNLVYCTPSEFLALKRHLAIIRGELADAAVRHWWDEEESGRRDGEVALARNGRLGKCRAASLRPMPGANCHSGRSFRSRNGPECLNPSPLLLPIITRNRESIVR